MFEIVLLALRREFCQDFLPRTRCGRLSAEAFSGPEKTMTRTDHHPLCLHGHEAATRGNGNTIGVSVVHKGRTGRLGLVALIGSTDGFTCVGAHAAVQSALEQATQERPQVLLLDLANVERGALNGVRQFRDRFPRAESLVLVPWPEPRPITALLEAGAGGCLVKPVPPVKLLCAITELHHRGATLCGEVARLLLGDIRKRGAARRTLVSLTHREHEILECLADGLQSKDIACHCAIGLQTVNSHLTHIYKKLGVRSRAAAVAKLLTPAA